jgi:hypothetical protein
MKTLNVDPDCATGLCIFRIRDAEHMLPLLHDICRSVPLVVYCGISPSQSDQYLLQRLPQILTDYASFPEMVHRFRSSRRRRSVRVAHYSNETMHITQHLTFNQNDHHFTRGILLAPIAIQGTHKVKNLIVKFISSQLAVPIVFAVIYVPEGTAEAALVLGSGDETNPVSLYEPSQNVMLYGQFVTSASGPQTFHTRLARFIQAGDGIVILFQPVVGFAQAWQCDFDLLVNYTICYEKCHSCHLLQHTIIGPSEELLLPRDGTIERNSDTIE